MNACRRTIVVVVWTFLVLGWCNGQDGAEDPCDGFDQSCGDCIRAAPECVWCSDKPGENSITGCRIRAGQGQCGVADIEDPQSNHTVVRNDPFSDEEELVIQVRPQEITAQLRPGIPVSFNVSVKPARNYPLDLYLLMDLSASLQNDLITLKNISSELIQTIDNITVTSRVGFGSFVDKNALPFGLSTYRVNTTLPPPLNCVNFKLACLDPYAYQHILSLTSAIDQLNEALNSVDISASIDSPEGGLDAIAQAAVCQDIIGWRDNALRLLLILTDNTYHVAGDGRLGGIVRPFDGKCHLEAATIDDINLYQYAANTDYDYPSVYQLNQLLTGIAQLPITPIFAVTAERVESYENLAQHLDSAFVAEIEEDSSNIISLIRNAYSNVSQLVRLNPVGIPELEFEIEPIEGCEMRNEDNGCAGITFTDTVVFNVTVTLTECADSLADGQTQEVFLSSTFGRVTLNISQICSCDCEEEVNMTLHPDCSGSGTLVCGLCECIKGRSGGKCQCDEDEPTNPSCPLGLENQECSGRGECDGCNECDCVLQEGLFQLNYFGDACECDNSSCPQNSIPGSPFYQQLCSGEERGTCDCMSGLCECNVAPKSNRPFFGDACQCDPDVCFDPLHPSVECFAGEGVPSGTCACNTCDCPSNFISDELTGTCQAEQTICDENRGCAMCAKGVSTAQNCSVCDTVLVDNEDEAEILAVGFVIRCEFEDGDCVHSYYVDTNGDVYVEDGEDCEDDNLPWIIAVVTIATLLVVGVLALIIIKLILMLIDRFEYKKFTQGLEEADWAPHENPLYVNPQQDYKNVAYRARKRSTKLQ